MTTQDGYSPKENESEPVPSAKLYRFAFAKVLVIVLSALLCAGAVISVANDMYAFVKPTEEVTLTVEIPLSLSELAVRLEQLGVVANPSVFELYVRSKNKVTLVEAFSGQVALNTAMSYRELLAAFSSDT
ncbi:MAG: hypothetical protein E7668_04670 [Ruminococcaceae bacterium]|nr:hypothetical protein [Oscillospiraceae bacterium]